MSAVLVARFDRRSDVAPIVRAALDADIVYVALPEVPAPGRHTLQLWSEGVLVAALVAELVGSGREGGQYPLRVRPLDPGHLAELEQLAARPSIAPAPSAAPAGPRPSRRGASIGGARGAAAVAGSGGADAEDRTLASRVEDRTLTSGVPSGAVPSAAVPSAPVPSSQKPRSDPASDGEVVATTVFDPDHVMAQPPRAPAGGRSSADREDESLTIPRSSAGPAVPPPAKSARASTRQSRPPRPSGRPGSFFNDEETQTLPGSSRQFATGTPAVSWNVRIAPTTKDPLCGRIIGGGKYILDSVIGEGAIGIVFKASHKDLGRTVAIKVLNPRYRDDPELLQVFRTEARAASLLEHPNVARVYDYGQEPDGLVYIVMEFLSGYTLGNALGARRKLTPSRAVEIMTQVCAALSAAHDRDIVHRDVKPDNIVLVPAQDDEGQPVEVVKVCDFGIAALGTPGAPGAVEEDHAAGTPEYMAPEQTTGGAVTPAADVYACGIVLYEMLAGEVPFKADAAFRILLKHRTETPRPPSTLTPGISPALEAIVMRCLEKQPEKRFRTARDLRAELRKIADAKP